MTEYRYEEKALKKALGGEVYSILKELNCIVAGGAITSIFTNNEINDIDVYFRSKEDVTKLLGTIMGYGDGEYIGSAESFSLHISFYTNRSILVGGGGCNHPIQLITFKFFEDVQDIFDTFDFTVCMGAYDFATESFTLHPEFLKHNAQKYISFNTGTAFPLISLLRMNKYKDKGYYVSKQEFLRCALTASQLQLNSWEDAIDHIGGMYGYVLEDTFDTSREFSINELVDQLSTIRDIDVPTIQTENTIEFIPIVKTYWPTFEQDLDAVIEDISKGVESTYDEANFDTDRYWYKCCNINEEGEYISKLSTSKLTYLEGEVIEKQPYGVFVHSNPREPYTNSKYWVELKLLNGDVRDRRASEAVLCGDVEVVRCFEFTAPSSDVEDAALCKLLGVDND